MTNCFTYAHLAPKLLSNGYPVIPVVPGKKYPIIKNWTDIDFFDENVVEKYVKQCGKYSVGLITGKIVSVDIDCFDEGLASRFQTSCLQDLGASPIRIGLFPKRMLFYRLLGNPFSKVTTNQFYKDDQKQQVEFLGHGSQCVIYGIHPDTQEYYRWVDDDLLDIPFENLSQVTETQILNFKLKVERILSLECEGAKSEHLALSGQSTADERKSIPEPIYPELPLLLDALKHLDSQDYSTWISVGHALKASGLDQALDIFVTWSANRPDGSRPRNYIGEADVSKRFEDFKPTRTHINAIFTRASQNGWQGGERLLGGILSHTSIAKYLLSKEEQKGPRPVYDEGHLWKYKDTHWQKITDGEQWSWVQDLDGLRVGRKTILSNKSFIDGVLSELRSMCEHSGFFLNRARGINCQNGFLTIDERGHKKLKPHHPENGACHTLEIYWDPDIKLDPVGLLKTLLDGCFGTSAESQALKKLLFQIIGVVCSGASLQLAEPKAFILYGQTAANGKSQILNLIRALLPKEAVSAIPPGDLGKEQSLASLVGKSANLTDEISSFKAIVSEKMKQVVSGDEVPAKIVYQPVFTFRPTLLNIFATNKLPTFQGGVDNGVKRRLSVIPFEIVVPKENRIVDIGKRVAEEQGPLILALAVDELSELMVNKYYTLPDTVEAATQQWFKDADLLAQWLEFFGFKIYVSKYPVLCLDLYKLFKEDVKDFADEGYFPKYRHFVEQIREYLKQDPEYELVRISEGYAVKPKTLV